MSKEIKAYNNSQTAEDRKICNLLQEMIDEGLKGSTCKIWHAHPVWFIEGNPIVGYSKLKEGIRLMFWSGADFDEDKLKAGTGKFKDASMVFTDADQIDKKDLSRWLVKAEEIQWDYRNIVKRKGVLVRLK